MGGYVGVDGKAKEVNEIYVGVNGVARRVSSAYIGVNGSARLWFTGVPVYKYEILDTWDEIFSSIDDGTYARKYRIGSYKQLDLGDYGIINMQVVAHDADEKSDGSGTAPITWVSKELLPKGVKMNPAFTSVDKMGNGAVGGWEYSDMREYLKTTIKPIIEDNVRNRILNVKKYSKTYYTASKYENNVETFDDLWIPSIRELSSSYSAAETQGPIGYVLEKNKTLSGNTYSSNWWLRTGNNISDFYCIRNGSTYPMAANTLMNTVIGFCT